MVKSTSLFPPEQSSFLTPVRGRFGFLEVHRALLHEALRERGVREREGDVEELHVQDLVDAGLHSERRLGVYNASQDSTNCVSKF